MFSFSNYSHRGDEEAALVALAVSCFLHNLLRVGAEPTAQGLAPGQFISFISDWYLTAPPVLGGAMGLLVEESYEQMVLLY